MNTEAKNTAIVFQDTTIEAMPFVNKECGDTMLDEVLKNMEVKSQEI